MSRANRLILFLLVLLPCVGCDQATKSVARLWLPDAGVWSFWGDTIRLQLVHNQGAFLSLGASLPESLRHWLLVGGVGCLLFVLLGYALYVAPPRPWALSGIAMLFAGGVSNLVDRLVYDGHVVDFVNVGIGVWRTGTFNVADVAIMVGALMLLAGELLHPKRATTVP
ncbi:MAG: signal peptidase II [Syntrophobacteraceae bacterium]